ncbi:MAG: DUF47 family protein [Clostridia bacterium]|nr:DUF47 family protein [Clostridia bacterium]
MNSFFKKSVELSMKIEKYIDLISNSLTLFEKGIKSYLKQDLNDVTSTYERISNLETEADLLGTEIKVTLYQFMLLPDTRADVLSLVKSLDNIIDATEEIFKDFHIQCPVFPEKFHNDILTLTENSVKSAESLLMASRAFFNELYMVSAYISKIKFYEHEADIIQDKIGEKIFHGEDVHELAYKLQLNDFIAKISSIADEAEIIGDKLTIFSIKREV